MPKGYVLKDDVQCVYNHLALSLFTSTTLDHYGVAALRQREAKQGRVFNRRQHQEASWEKMVELLVTKYGSEVVSLAMHDILKYFMLEGKMPEPLDYDDAKKSKRCPSFQTPQSLS